MSRWGLSIALTGLLIAGWSAPPAVAQPVEDDKSLKALDQKFEELLVAAQKDPKKADWNALRHAFAETSHYQPYNAGWREEISKVTKNLREGNLKEAEAALTRLLERERYMRIDALALAVALYEKTEDSEKARMHKGLLEGLSATVFAPSLGKSFEKPIEVLYIEEEYAVLAAMGSKLKHQALSERDGHRFDVLTTEAKPREPERQLYFNIDIPWRSFERSMMKDLGESKKADRKK
jgi:Domain of unknown function (DUF4919)